MLLLLKRPQYVLKIFLIFLFGCNVISENKGHRADGGIFFSDFMLISKKKSPSSEFCKFSTRFVQHRRARHHEPQLSTVFGGKKKPDFAKFQCENAEKNFALLGNTVKDYVTCSFLRDLSMFLD